MPTASHSLQKHRRTPGNGAAGLAAEMSMTDSTQHVAIARSLQPLPDVKDLYQRVFMVRRTVVLI
jgi:hypothetical protein